MSKKDYQAIAQIMREVKLNGGDEGTLLGIAIRMGYLFKVDNPLYNHDKFLAACDLDKDLAAI